MSISAGLEHWPPIFFPGWSTFRTVAPGTFCSGSTISFHVCFTHLGPFCCILCCKIDTIFRMLLSIAAHYEVLCAYCFAFFASIFKWMSSNHFTKAHFSDSSGPPLEFSVNCHMDPMRRIHCSIERARAVSCLRPPRMSPMSIGAVRRA